MAGKFRLGCCVLLMMPVTALAGTEQNGRGARSVGLATSVVALPGDPWALYYNPSGLSTVRSIRAAAFFIPQQFGLRELQTTAFTAAVPLAFGTMGVGFSQFGFELYKETELSVGVGCPIDWGLSAGIALHVTRISIDQYGSTQNATLDGGLMAQLDDEVSLGFSVRNLFGSKLGATDERLPQDFSLGLKYSPIRSFLITAMVEKDIRYPTIAKAGVEQQFLDVLRVRVGVSNNPDKFSIGMALHYSLFEFAYAGYSHPELGWTHQLEISASLDQ